MAMRFPITDLLSQQESCDFLLRVLHPKGGGAGRFCTFSLPCKAPRSAAIGWLDVSMDFHLWCCWCLAYCS